MNGLKQLRSRLAGLRRRRRLARWIAAYSALAVALLWALIAALLGDWLFDMPARRLILEVVALKRYEVINDVDLPPLPEPDLPGPVPLPETPVAANPAAPGE